MKKYLAFLFVSSSLILTSISCVLLVRTGASMADESSSISSSEQAALSDHISMRLAGIRDPRINLGNGLSLLTAYADAEMENVFEENLARPLTLVSADFDEDGAPDLISGYAGMGGGILTLHRGNADAIYPNSPDAQQRRARDEFTSAPFLSPAEVFELPESPDFSASGDFDADGHQDIVTAARGSNSLYFLQGNGRGSFNPAHRIALEGRVTALASGEINRADGLADLVVGIAGIAGPRALVFEGREGAVKAESEILDLPAEATAFVLGRLDEDHAMDLAVAAGNHLLLFNGRNHKPVPGQNRLKASRRSFASAIKSAVTGNFTGDNRADLALLFEDGIINVLSPKETGNKKKNRKIKKWKSERLTDESWPLAARLVRANVSSLPTDDLVLMDPVSRRMHILNNETDRRSGEGDAITSAPRSLVAASFDMEGEPAAVLPMRLNADALNDLVALTTGGDGLAVALTGHSNASSGSRLPLQTFNFSNPTSITIADSESPPTPAIPYPSDIMVSGISGVIDKVTVTLTDINHTFPDDIDVLLVGPTGSAVILMSDVGGGEGQEAIGAGGTVTKLSAPSISNVNLTFDDDALMFLPDEDPIVSGTFKPTNIDFGGPDVFPPPVSNPPIATGLGIFNGTIPNGTWSLFVADDESGDEGTIAGGWSLSLDVSPITVTNTDDADPGSLRLAIDIANSNPGPDTIVFNIPGTGVQTITPMSPLPNITESVTIDGTTQPGFAGTPLIAIDGAMAGSSVDGLVLDEGSNVIRGLQIVSFDGSGIRISGIIPAAPIALSSSGNIIEGNLIGTDSAGSSGLGNLDFGVLISNSPSNTIGGATPSARNVISGNSSNGILMQETGSMGNCVQGNFIGTDPSGTVGVGNSGSGVAIFGAPGNMIGGPSPSAGNLISGNGFQGVFMQEGADSNLIQGNLIGTQVDGTSPLGNSSTGIMILASQDNTIGGTAPGEENTIAFSGSAFAGVEISSDGVGNSVLGNSIFNNGGLGIDLDGDGVTANDPLDQDTGTNNLQNFPLLTSAVTDGISTTIQGTLASAPNSNFRIEFFSNISCDPSGNGEGMTSLGFTNVMTDNGGNASFNITFPIAVPIGQFVTATATDSFDNTSEFSPCVTVVLENCIISCPQNIIAPNDAGQCSAIIEYPPPQTTGTCGTVTCAPVSGSAFSVGTTTVNCATMAGPSCSFTVTVNDTEPPAIACLTGITVSNDVDQCSAVVSYPVPAVTDNCPGAGTASCVPAPGSTFPIGATVVTCTASDSAGNLANCAFTVMVNDTQLPRVSCPGSVVTSTAPGASSAVVNYAIATVTDNCPGATVVCLPPSGTSFNVGVSTVTCASNDASGNTATCTFTVTVNDRQAPNIMCPADVFTSAASGQNSAAVNFPAPNVSDNLPGVTVACSPPSGSIFPLGFTNVACTAIDAVGNRSVCTFRVSVSPVERPSLDRATLDLGSAIVVPAENPPSGMFSIINPGPSALNFTFASISRTGNSVNNGIISNPDDSAFYTIEAINTGGPPSPRPFQLTETILPGQQRSFRIIFDPFIPAVADGVAGLAATQVLPDVLTSRVTITQTGGDPLTLDLTARVSSVLRLIDPDTPTNPPVISFSRSGNRFTLIYSVFDSDLDVNRAVYEFLDSSGQVVGDAFDINLAQPLQSANLVKGQSFTVEQGFSGVGNRSSITQVRLTIFDGETSVSATANLNGSSGTQNNLRRPDVRLVLPDARRVPRAMHGRN